MERIHGALRVGSSQHSGKGDCLADVLQATGQGGGARSKWQVKGGQATLICSFAVGLLDGAWIGGRVGRRSGLATLWSLTGLSG